MRRYGEFRKSCAIHFQLEMGDQQTYRRSQGRIDRIEVTNFKSYRGFQNIGPFHAFTAVIGPNGRWVCFWKLEAH